MLLIESTPKSPAGICPMDAKSRRADFPESMYRVRSVSVSSLMSTSFLSTSRYQMRDAPAFNSSASDSGTHPITARCLNAAKYCATSCPKLVSSMRS